MRKVKKNKISFTAVKKRGMACILAATMIITALPMSGINAKAEGKAPTQDLIFNKDTNTYEIYTAQGLCDFRDNVSGNLSSSVKLMNDIDLSSVCGESISGVEVSFKPLGSEYAYYNGTFDGNGYSIANLYVNDKQNGNYDPDVGGLFQGNEGTIKNLNLVDANITAIKSVGGLTYENKGTIENCSVSGKVTSTKNSATGIAYDNGGTIENCAFYGSVSVNSGAAGGIAVINNANLTCCVNNGTITSANSTATGGIVGVNNKTADQCDNKGQVTATGENVGGIAGSNTQAGVITRSSNEGIISGTTKVGGVCGEMSGGSVSLCYNAGDVTGTTTVGGVCGEMSGGSLKSCYNTIRITGTTVWGGVCGSNENGTITNSYYYCYDNDSVNNLKGTTKKTIREMKKGEFISLLNGADSAFVKDIGGENTGFPILSWQEKKDYFGGGTGTEEDPYLIYTPQQLANFRNASNVRIDVLNAKVMADLDMSSVCCEKLGSWIGISGVSSSEYSSDSFKGIFDGNNKTITNLYLDNQNSMFSFILNYGDGDAKIRNVILSNVKIGKDNPRAVLLPGTSGPNIIVENCKVINSTFLLKGGLSFAPIVGEGNATTISNCYSNADIMIDNANCAGIVYSSYGIVTDCVFEGSIQSNSFVQCLAGICASANGNATIKNCINRGNITASHDFGQSEFSTIGGIVSEFKSDYGKGIITNCINEGKIISNKMVAGGICGETNGNAYVENCINKGEVTGGYRAGGIVCSMYNASNINNCLNVGTVSGNTAFNSSGGLGGVAGYISSGTVTNSYYLDTAVKGEATNTNGTAIPVEVLGSGETAYLLGGAFGQMITGTAKDQYPVFRLADNVNQVLKVSFKPYGGTITDSSYTNYNKQIVIPAAYNDGTFGFKTSDSWISETQSVTTDLEVTAITKPSYIVTIPAEVNFGDVKRVLENKPESEKIVKTDGLSVSAKHSNLFINEQALTVCVDGSNLKMTNVEGTDVSFALYFSDATPINSKVDVLRMTAAELDTDVQASKQFYATLDQSQIRVEGAYNGTITFTVALTDIA